MMKPETLLDHVKNKYAAAARQIAAGRPAGCGCDAVTAELYAPEQAAGLPASAVSGSLGCGNPTLLAALHPGETVLDLGSGGGLDVLLSARRVAPDGKAYGLDMTDEMLALAREHQRQAGIANAEFLRGTLEAIPLPEASVDVVISNCVVNLAADKDRALREAFRVLKPGGRFAVSDVVIRGAMPAALRRDLGLWAGCVAGALSDTEYEAKLAAAGFAAIAIEATGGYEIPAYPELAGRLFAAFVRAHKPA